MQLQVRMSLRPSLSLHASNYRHPSQWRIAADRCFERGLLHQSHHLVVPAQVVTAQRAAPASGRGTCKLSLC